MSAPRTLRMVLLAAAGAAVAWGGCVLDRSGSFTGVAGMGGAGSVGGAGGDENEAGGMGGGVAGFGGAGGKTPECGDGYLDADESCDDGNLIGGDGCSAECGYDAAAQCPPTSELTLEPGVAVTLTGTTFGAGDELAGSCATIAQGSSPEVSYRVRPSQAGTLQAYLIAGFNKSLYIRETCTGMDAGCNEVDFGANGRVQIPVQEREPHFVVVDMPATDATGTFELTLLLNICGDGDRSQHEECDDGNTVAGDGCSESCVVECDNGFKRSDDHHCYRRFTDNRNWNDALADCMALGPGWSLAGVSSAEERNFIDDVVNPSGHSWVGGNDLITEGTFVWINDEPFDFDGWANNEPNNAGGNEDCIEFLHVNGNSNDRFNDDGCDHTQDFICELTPAGGTPPDEPPR